MKVKDLHVNPAKAKEVIDSLFGSDKANEIIRLYSGIDPKTYRPRSWLQRFCVVAAQLKR